MAGGRGRGSKATARNGSVRAPKVRALRGSPAEKLLAELVRLGRELRIDMSEEELIHTFVRRASALLPGRSFCVRLVDPESNELSLVYATGKLVPHRREPLKVTLAAVQAAGVDPEVVARHGFEVTSSYANVFDPQQHGIDVLLARREHVYGVLNVEHQPTEASSVDERAVVQPLAELLSASLRNAHVLRESMYLRGYLEKILDHANALIVVIGRDRRIQVVNRAVERFLGRTREELLDADFMLFLPEEERPRVLPTFVRTLRGTPPVHLEIKLQRADGTMSRVAFNTAPILSPEQDIEGIIAIGQDLTEVRLLQDQVIQAEKLSTLGQLAAGVVHELNNPLTSISVYSDYLAKKLERQPTVDAGDLEKIRRILQGAERILRFTRDLTSYARPATDEPSHLDLHQVIDQALIFCDHLIEEGAVTLVRVYQEPKPRVFGIAAQLQQVFINLVTNACHAMEPGNGRVVLRTEPGPAGHVRVVIEDNGCGITPEELACVFEPFFTTKVEGRGTGLGLSIVRNIVRNHGGEVSMTSEVGKGTAVTVALPLHVESE